MLVKKSISAIKYWRDFFGKHKLANLLNETQQQNIFYSFYHRPEINIK